MTFFEDMKLKLTSGQCAERIRLFSSNRVLRAIMSCAVVYFAVDSTDVNATEEGKNKLHASGSSNSEQPAVVSKKAQKKQKKEQGARQSVLDRQEARRRAQEEQIAKRAVEELLQNQEEQEAQRLAQEEQKAQRVAQEQQAEKRVAQEQQEEKRVAQEQQAEKRVAQEQQAEKRVVQEQQAEKRVVQEQQEEKRVVQEQQEEKRVVQEQQEERWVVQEQQEERWVVQEQQEERWVVQEQQEERWVVQEQQEEKQVAQEQQEEKRVAQEQQEEKRVVQEQQEEKQVAQEQQEEKRVVQEQQEEKRVAQEQQEEKRLAQEQQEVGQQEEALAQVHEEEAHQQEEASNQVKEEPAQQESAAVDSKPREAVALIDDKPSPDDRLREMIASYSLLEGNVLHSAERMSEDGTIVVGEGFINGRAQPFIARDDEGKIGIVGLLDLNDSLNNATLYSSVLQSAVQTFVQDSMRCSNFDQYGVCISAGALYSHNAGKVNGANWQGEFSAAYRINDDWIAGLGYQAPSYRFDVSNDTMRNRASLFGLFAEYGTRTRPGVFARVALGYQQGDLSIDRSYLTASGVDRSKGDTTVAQRAVSTQGGYVFTVRNASIMPYLGIDYLRTKLGDYTETSGQFPVRFSARTDGNVYGTVGLSSHLRFTDQTVISAGVKHVQRLSKSNDPVSASVSAFDPFVVGAESTRQWSEISVGGRFATPVKASSLDIGYRRRFASGAAVAQDMGSVFFTMGF
ncbi:autotransporter domain-containing protein (plasmid) [Mycetohabitans rhizoxinica]